MKKIFAFIALIGILSMGHFSAQDTNSDAEMPLPIEEEVSPGLDSNEENLPEEAESDGNVDEEETGADKSAAGDKEECGDDEAVSPYQDLKIKFIEGGPIFMAFVLICLILGLAMSIERIIYLNLATTNTKKLMSSIEEALQNGGVDAAKEVCRNTRGPVASIFYQGLERSSEGVEMVEKSVISYGGVQMGLLEKGLSWIGLFIAIAPMLGFMGTVIGMIDAFTTIAEQGEADPKELSKGIKVALITTVSGLVVAIILQIFYNYIVSKIDSLVNEMEDASISLIDLLVKHEVTKK
jgi:biopolymer transport protein ExbB